MKSILLILLCAMAASGCSSLSREQLAAYKTPEIPEPVSAKIQAHARLTMPDIVDLSHSGVRSSQIITYLAYTNTEFTLTPEDVENLRQEGVSGDVITYLREQPNKTGGLLSTFFTLD